MRAITYQTMNEKVDVARRTEEALAHCGFEGIYDTFDSPADAICQMAGYIRELGRKLERAQAREVELVRAGRTLSSLARPHGEEPEFTLDPQDLAEFDSIVEWEEEGWNNQST